MTCLPHKGRLERGSIPWHRLIDMQAKGQARQLIVRVIASAWNASDTLARIAVRWMGGADLLPRRTVIVTGELSTPAAAWHLSVSVALGDEQERR